MLHDIPPLAPEDTVSLTESHIIVSNKSGKHLYDIKRYKLPEKLYGEKTINLETSIYNLTANVIDYCQSHHIGIGEFEKEVGVSYGYFSRIRKTMNPSFDIIVKVANKLGYSIAELFSDKWNNFNPEKR